MMIETFQTNLKLQEDAAMNGVAVGAFNTNNLEISQAIIKAAKDEQAPVILGITPSAIKYGGLWALKAMIAALIEESGITASLHLDHGDRLETVERCLRVGFSSVMMDASAYPLEENIDLTRQAVAMAKSYGASVEGELGKLAGVEEHVSVDEREAAMTDPKQAAVFVEQTGVDALAVAIGNAHGFYKGKPQLDFERLKEIRDETYPVQLVLHGASGIPAEDIKTAISLGITKINIDTEIRAAFTRGTSDFIKAHPDVIDPRKILNAARDEMIEIVKQKIRLFQGQL